jgi:hypothetical protein
VDKRVVEVYSHITDEVEAQLQTALKHAWLNARTPSPSTQSHRR